VAVLSNIEEKHLEEYLQNLCRVRAVLAVKICKQEPGKKDWIKLWPPKLKLKLKPLDGAAASENCSRYKRFSFGTIESP